LVAVRITVLIKNGRFQTSNATEGLIESKVQSLNHVSHIPVNVGI
jgi:hypothetical protein